MNRFFITLISTAGIALVGTSAIAQEEPDAPVLVPSSDPTIIADEVEPTPNASSADLETEPVDISSLEPAETRDPDDLSEAAEQIQLYDWDGTLDLNTEAYQAPGPAEPSQFQIILE